MKKIIIIFTFLIVFTFASILVLSSGGGTNTLYLLNWGEYINQDLVVKFENEFNCSVVEETVTSSETMYQKIVSNTTSYDVAIPGDYMVTKLKNEGYLKKLDINNQAYTNITNARFVDDLESLREKYNFENEYSMPYFWGAYSIIYNTKNEEVEEVIKNNGFKALFDKSLYDSKVKTGMYSTARWALAAYLMATGQDPNTEDFDEALVSSEIKAANFDVWGDDQLKRQTATGNLDLVFTQLGDFFDALWLSLEEGLDTSSDGSFGLDALPFNVNVPTNTCAFFDAMVIPTTSKNYDLANEFINFMLEPQNAYENALAIGYCPTLTSVDELYLKAAEDGELYYEDEANPARNITMAEFINKYPVYLNPLVNSNIDTVSMFEPKDADYMTLCESVINQAKSAVKTNSNLGLIVCSTVVSVIGLWILGYAGLKIYQSSKKKRTRR